MKTIYDSNPEFSLTYTHRGVSATLSGKVLLEDYLSTADSDQGNEELLGLVVQNALPNVASEAARLLTQFHPEFETVLAASLTADLRRSFSPPSYESDNEGNIIVKTEEKS